MISFIIDEAEKIHKKGISLVAFQSAINISSSAQIARPLGS